MQLSPRCFLKNRDLSTWCTILDYLYFDVLIVFWLMLNSVHQQANYHPWNLVFSWHVQCCLMLFFTCLETGSCYSRNDILRGTDETEKNLNYDSDLNKRANKRAIGGRAVKGFSFNKSYAITTLKLKRLALKSVHEALYTDLLMSVFVMSLFLCVPVTHKDTLGWFIPSTGQVNWSRPFRLVFSSGSNESNVSRLSKQCTPVS